MIKIKNRYTVDSSNRLLIRRNRKNLIADGKFSIDKNNRLIYWLNKPESWRRQYNLPNKINFIGNWKLNPNYDLELELAETKNQFAGDRLVLKGEIISADKDMLVFEMISYDKLGQTHIQLIKLSGFWQADEFNRIGFVVKKKALPNILTLEGSWQINRNQQIIYTYEKTDLKRKSRVSRTLTFEGFWRIDSKNKLTYILSNSSKSRFDFRVQIESPNVYPQEGAIKYRLGVGLRGEKNFESKILCLYGTWKFSRKLGLTFEMDYGKGKTRNLEFGADIAVTSRDKITFVLKNETGLPLGINITFTHKFLKQSDAESFLRFKNVLNRKRGIEAGVTIPF